LIKLEVRYFYFVPLIFEMKIYDFSFNSQNTRANDISTKTFEMAKIVDVPLSPEGNSSFRE
jgi:hypothetical protein